MWDYKLKMQKESNFLSFQCDRTCQCYVFLSGTPRYMIHHTDLSNWVTFYTNYQIWPRNRYTCRRRPSILWLIPNLKKIKNKNSTYSLSAMISDHAILNVSMCQM